MDTSAIENYCAQHTSAPDDALRSVYRSIAMHTVNPNMSSSPYQGVLLQLFTQMTAPAIAVEIGSFAGYGAISIARGMPAGGTIHVIEANEEYEETILHHAQMASVSDRIRLHIGQALSIIPILPDGIGLAFIDADKTNYENYYRLLLPKMRPGGILIFDNMLWYGRVMEEPETQLRCDRSTRIIQHLNDLITADPRVDNILLPVRDGLMLCRVVDANNSHQ